MKTLNAENHEALLAYLREKGHIAPTEEPTLTNLSGGVSNRTVLVERANGDAWVIKQALEKLRVAIEWYSDPERIHNEAMGLRWLRKLAPNSIPRLIFEDYKFKMLAMAAIPQPHDNWKDRLLAGQLKLEHVTQFGKLLGTIHRRASGDNEIAAIFSNRNFFESLRVEPYYSYTAVQDPEAKPFLDALIEETRAHRLTLVHGDYSPKNILVYQDRLVLLDHEVIHWGDPSFDLGFSMTHLLSKANHMPAHRAEFAEAAKHYWHTYIETVGPLAWVETLEPRTVRSTLGCLLARIDGRSALEYLSEEARTRQRAAVIALMQDAPTTVNGLVDAFVEKL